MSDAALRAREALREFFSQRPDAFADFRQTVDALDSLAKAYD